MIRASMLFCVKLETLCYKNAGILINYATSSQLECKISGKRQEIKKVLKILKCRPNLS